MYQVCTSISIVGFMKYNVAISKHYHCRFNSFLFIISTFMHINIFGRVLIASKSRIEHNSNIESEPNRTEFSKLSLEH